MRRERAAALLRGDEGHLGGGSPGGGLAPEGGAEERVAAAEEDEAAEADVIKKHLINLKKKKTFKSSKSTALDIAGSIREDVEYYFVKEVNITTCGEDVVQEARKGTHEVLMADLCHGDGAGFRTRQATLAYWWRTRPAK